MSKKPLALVIEDDEDLVSLFADAMGAAGFEAEIIRNGYNALIRLDEIEPTVVVLDLHLPGVPGQDILQQIRGQRRLLNTQVVLATADPGLADSLATKADLVLIKPISFSQLRDLATRLMPPDTTDTW